MESEFLPVGPILLGKLMDRLGDLCLIGNWPRLNSDSFCDDYTI